MKKSQSSTEFMIFIGMAIIILMAYFAISHGYLNLTYKQKDIISGQDLAKQIKNEINLASRVEDNYHRTFDLPTKVGGKDFSVILSKREVIITIDNLDYVELLSIDVTEEGFIQYSSGENIEINKVNGRIYLGELMCTRGETRCGTLEECGATYPCVMECNDNQWIKIEDCDERCDEGECKLGVCDFGDTKCGNPIECPLFPEDECIFSCNEQNQWNLIFDYSCTQPDTCEEGECVCNDGTMRCGTIEECSPSNQCVVTCNSNQWTSTQICDPNICLEGECIGL